MNIQLREHIVRIQIIEITGRLEAWSVGDLRGAIDQLTGANHYHFVVDLQQVEFMDSAGMSALVALLKRARQGGGDVVLVKPLKQEAYRILTLTRFDQVFQMSDSVDEALGYF